MEINLQNGYTLIVAKVVGCFSQWETQIFLKLSAMLLLFLNSAIGCNDQETSPFF